MFSTTLHTGGLNGRRKPATHPRHMKAPGLMSLERQRPYLFSQSWILSPRPWDGKSGLCIIDHRLSLRITLPTVGLLKMFTRTIEYD